MAEETGQKTEEIIAGEVGKNVGGERAKELDDEVRTAMSEIHGQLGVNREGDDGESPEREDEEEEEDSSGRPAPPESDTAINAFFNTPAHEPSVPVEKDKAMQNKKRPIRGQEATQNIFKDKLPPDQKLHIYREDEDGHYPYDDVYMWRDIESYGNIEAFLKKKKGGGVYKVEREDSNRKRYDCGIFRILAKPEEDRTVTGIREMAEINKQMLEEARKTGDEKLSATAEIIKAIQTGKKEGTDPGIMAVLVAALQQKEQKPDATEKLINLAILDWLEKKKEPPPPVIPIPATPVAAASGTSEAIDLLKVLAQFSQLSANQPQQMGTPEMFLKMLELISKKDDEKKGGIEFKDILESISKMKDILNPGASDFNTQLNNWDKVNERLERMSQKGGSDIGGILSQVAEGIASTFGAIRDMKMANYQPPLSNSSPPPQITVKPPEQNFAQTEGQQAPVLPKNTPPSIPTGFRKFTIQMKKSFVEGDEGMVLNAFMTGLDYLAERGERKWAIHVNAFLRSIKEDEKEKALKFAHAFLLTFEANNLVPKEIEETVLGALDVFWKEIKEKLVEITEGVPVEQAEAAEETIEEKKEEQQEEQPVIEVEEAPEEEEEEG
jgi:hypothetical protein